MTPSTEDTPIFDLLRNELGATVVPPKPAFTHGDGTPCHGCQSCIAEAYEGSDVDGEHDVPRA